MKPLLHAFVCISSLFAAAAALAQTYPSKPVRIEVGYVPGGGVDTTARMVGNALGDLWGQQVIIENRPGAAGNVATEYTAKAPPDGYTLVLCNIGSHAVTPARFAKKLTYDPIGDFAFPAMIGGVPNLFMVHPSFPAKTLKQFVAYAKANPGKVNFGSSGVGASPHLSIELFKLKAGIDIVHVPYKGAAEALRDAIGGQIEASVGNMAGAPIAAVRAGRMRALGVTSGKRSPQLPDVPTFAEQGVPDYDVTGWYGICTQSKVPPPVLQKLGADIQKALAGPLKAQLEREGVQVNPQGAEFFRNHVKAEIERWTKVVQQAHLEGD